ncbi:DoxX-like family protein [Lysinibacillus sp. NPDC047702]|uniref:DoxX-like family protein n=1 Tax=unclassified Lysinibacillus TaxID=2636778 RepID=UPI003D056527
MKKKPIYVEVDILAPIEEAWTYTQNPKLHEQWDLRFTSITYIEKKSVEEPQRFTYETKVISGVVVRGWGESKGEHQKKDGTKTSSLHFGTPQKISPIAEGRGYWQYIPHKKGLTFLTQYDYDVRYGKLGKLLDVMFRPIMGWATALSFDVLKRWLEKGENPASQYRRFFLTTLISVLFCFVWLYHGLVPKIIVQHPTEVMLMEKILERDLHQLSEPEMGLSEIELEPSEIGVRQSGYRVELSKTDVGLSGYRVEPSKTDVELSEIGVNPSRTEVELSESENKLSETNAESSKIEMNLSKITVKPNEEAVSSSNANQIVIGIGIAEVLFGLCWLLPRGKRLLFVAQIILFPLLTIGAVFTDMTIAAAPFNPVTFNLALWVLSIVGLIISKDMPSARSCIRKRGESI